MPRIDDHVGRVPTARPSGFGVPAVQTGFGLAVSQLVRQGAAGLSAVEREAEERARQEEEAADRISAVREISAFRQELADAYADETSGYDGSFPGFADTFGAALDERLNARLEAAPARLQPQIAEDFERLAAEYRLTAGSYERQQRNAFRLRGIREVIDDEVTAVARNPALLGSVEEQIDQLVEAAPVALQSELSADAKRRAALSALGSYEGGDPELGLLRLEAGDYDRFLSAEDVATAKIRLTSARDRQEAERDRNAEKAVRLAERTVTAGLAAIDRRLEAGIGIEPERWDRLSEAAETAGPDIAQRVADERRAVDAAQALQLLPRDQATQAMQEIRQRTKGGASDANALLLERAEAAFAGMQRELDRDPLGFSSRHRGGITPLDLGNPVQSLETRASEAEEAAEHYGVATTYFTADERASLMDQLQDDPQQRLNFVLAVAEAGAPGMLAEFSEVSGGMAQIAGMVSIGGDAGFARDALAGADLRRSGQSTAVRRGTADAIALETYGNAFALVPTTAPHMQSLAEDAFLYQANQNGWTAEEFDRHKDDFVAQLQRAVGAHGRAGGVQLYRNRQRSRHVWLPADQTIGSFKQTITSSTDEQLTAALSGQPRDAEGRPIALADLRRALPVAVAPSVYRLEARADFYVVDEQGRPLTLDFNLLRRPQGDNND